jgi:two-component system, NtrC family, sensor histidine kinase HydH
MTRQSAKLTRNLLDNDRKPDTGARYVTRNWTGTSTPRRRPRLLWRIVLPFAAGGLLLLTVGAVAAWYVVRLQESASDILAWNVSSIRAAEELELVIRETRYRLNQYLLTGDPAHLKEAAALRESTEQWIDEAHRLASMPEEEQLAEQLRDGFRRFLQESERLAEGDADPEVVRRLARDILPDEVLRPARLYLDLNEQHLARSSEENQTMAERLGIGLLLLGLCGAVAGLVSGYGLARGISRSILQLSVPMRDVAGQLGDVLGPVTLSADPQVEDLEGLLQIVSERVATVITQLQESQRTAIRAEHLASLGQFAAGLAHELRCR